MKLLQVIQFRQKEVGVVEMLVKERQVQVIVELQLKKVDPVQEKSLETRNAGNINN
ncbi:hypothetical protein LZQ00_10870 [Sphingobacterium sp. SRCM116780]|uniref:hypothetical protein n=1 Tax=Sphingobacterium sp. SRCM116780 TaxID=2907623 RepID=UPI001F3D8184|nr:hypothetical protein [Sphingobacterium sp. SRCM116780]UIR54778.1 hypothetical protein LZQ00_10870 [Sphingobacterium sp. SRCM116780]